ncbi:hypothetical protein [Helicobacter bilis]|nr:hypothetical protein [Helicobacter bilis]
MHCRVCMGFINATFIWIESLQGYVSVVTPFCVIYRNQIDFMYLQ